MFQQRILKRDQAFTSCILWPLKCVWLVKPNLSRNWSFKESFSFCFRYLLSLGADTEAENDCGEKPADLIDPDSKELLELFGVGGAWTCLTLMFWLLSSYMAVSMLKRWRNKGVEQPLCWWSWYCNTLTECLVIIVWSCIFGPMTVIRMWVALTSTGRSSSSVNDAVCSCCRLTTVATAFVSVCYNWCFSMHYSKSLINVTVIVCDFF